MSTIKTSQPRNHLPNISSANFEPYSQRYQHMTKLANYNEMNESQIWKEYEKLRTCLKDLNEEVLYFMEKKAYNNINNKEKNKLSKDTETTLILLEHEKRLALGRKENFTTELANLEERIKYLSSKTNLYDEMVKEGEQLNTKIKDIVKDNKLFKRKAKLLARDLTWGSPVLQELSREESKLLRSQKYHRNLEQTLEVLEGKSNRYIETIDQLQKAIDMRLNQFSHQENFIQEEIHFERYEQLSKQKQLLKKYESIYKRNYLMKLKELESLVNSVSRHDRVIQETEVNIDSMRIEIKETSALVGNHRRRNVSVKQDTARRSKQNKTVLDVSLDAGERDNNGAANDKNPERNEKQGRNDKNVEEATNLVK